MVAVLGKQLDFKNVDPSLMVLVKGYGGVAIVLPKFHCELNPIELCGVDRSTGSAGTSSTPFSACGKTYPREQDADGMGWDSNWWDIVMGWGS